MPGFDTGMTQEAAELLDIFRSRELRLATAESCTGGLVAAAMTEIAGSSDVFDRGFVTYSNEAKVSLLGVGQSDLDQFGAVSVEVAAAMARGAIKHSDADVAVSVTGIAGPGGGSPEKPVGLVCFGVADRHGRLKTRISNFGEIGRREIRLHSVRFALDFVKSFVQAE